MYTGADSLDANLAALSLTRLLGVEVGPRGDVPSASPSRWPYLHAGRATADACFNRLAPAAQALGAGLSAHCPSAARHAALNDHIGAFTSDPPFFMSFLLLFLKQIGGGHAGRQSG